KLPVSTQSAQKTRSKTPAQISAKTQKTKTTPAGYKKPAGIGTWGTIISDALNCFVTQRQN
ncbi:hypothetical protein MWU61_18965, partial [Loktanella sp. F6476L]|uniref:hypothetical protein n=1 Tax=Loktanella sp. F6476L TaxID=2926405 RepID=UPI001FF34667